MKALFKFLLFNVSPFSAHLWYLGAILYVLVIVYLLYKVCPKHADFILMAAAPLLLVGNIVLGGYALPLFHKEIQYMIIRNYLFMGLPYFAVGLAIRKNDSFFVNIKSRHGVLLVLFIVALIFSTITEETFLCHLGVSLTREHYISTPFLSILVFCCFIDNSWEGKLRAICCIGRNHATNIYIVHPMIIHVLDCVLLQKCTHEWYFWLRPIMCYILSIALSILYSKIRWAQTGKADKKALFRKKS